MSAKAMERAFQCAARPDVKIVLLAIADRTQEHPDDPDGAEMVWFGGDPAKLAAPCSMSPRVAADYVRVLVDWRVLVPFSDAEARRWGTRGYWVHFDEMGQEGAGQ